MARLDVLFEQFLRERRYLKNVTPKTLTWYESAWKAFRLAQGYHDRSAKFGSADLEQISVPSSSRSDSEERNRSPAIPASVL
jgi:hypothetical protein